mgnify:CR=1 FL=1
MTTLTLEQIREDARNKFLEDIPVGTTFISTSAEQELVKWLGEEPGYPNYCILKTCIIRERSEGHMYAYETVEMVQTVTVLSSTMREVTEPLEMLSLMANGYVMENKS